MGKRNAAAAIVEADRLQQFETPPKRMKHGPAAAATSVTPTTAASPPAAAELSSPNISASEFTLSKEFVDGTMLMDLTLKQWRIGKPIGKGSFGEIFLASDDIDTPVTSENAKYVVKIEPHSNGPLFVEIHCLLNTAKRTETCIIPPGMPEYIASGSHMFKNERYRFLILKRYQRDLHSLIKNKRVNPKSIPVIACQILDVLEHLHDQGYVHSDIKAENLMIGTVDGAAQIGVTNRLSNGHNGTDDQHQPQRSNGVTLPEGKGAKRGTKSSAEHHHQFNGSGAAVQENGLYFHQEQEMCTRTRNLRPLKTVTYRDLSDEDERAASAVRSRGNFARRRGRRRQNDTSFSCSISPRRSGYEELRAATEEAHWHELKRASLPKTTVEEHAPAEERIHLIDFGLASKFVDSSGQHRPFCMDQRRAHDGTLEFTSRDAHMGAHARRSDLECLGYNLVYWSRGFLPWKDEKLLNQPEQVHRMKEYFMTDVREMLRLIYGEDCPGYLGDFLAYVGNLTYDERPDYQYCKSLFYKELKRLGCPVSRTQTLRLDVSAIVQLSVPLTAQDEAEITNKINHVKSLMKLGALIPYRESTLHSKASSPKNLRSKRSDANGRNIAPTATTVTDGGAVSGASISNTANAAGSTICTRKKEKQFSCEDIFATDADQIARDRVEKEFERAEQMEETVIRYTGRPTYAIQELLERKSRGHSLGGCLEYTESEGYIKGYTKPMMDILRKRQSQLFRQFEEKNSTDKSNEVVTNTKASTESRIAANRQAVKKESASDSENAPMEQDSDRMSDDDGDCEERDEEDGDVAIEPSPGNDYEDEDDVSVVKLSKYEQDDDYELASEEEDDEDLLEDDDEKEVASSEEEENEEEEEEEDVEDEEEEEDVDEDYEEEQDEELVVQNGYESRGSHRRKTEGKSRKKEDTDSDFINDGGCEVEGTDQSNLPDGEELVEENDEDQQDSDFNDQDSTETDVGVPDVRPPKRKPGRPCKKQRSDSASDGRKLAKGRRGKINSSKSDHSTMSPVGTHDNEEEASDDPAVTDRYSGKRHVTKKRSGHRKKRKQLEVLDDGDGDNARLFEDQLETGSRLDDGQETVRKQSHHHYNNNNHCNSKAYYGDVDDSSHDMALPSSMAGGVGAIDRNASKYRYVKRRKSGLRERIRPTDRGTDYADNMQRKRKAALQNKRRRESAALTVDGSVAEEDYSCSSSTSSSSSSSSSSGSQSVSSSCTSNRSRMVSHCSSAASLDSASVVSSQIRRGRKRKQVATVSSRDSSVTRQSAAQCSTTAVRSRKKRTIVTDNETGHSNNRWSQSNSNGSQSAATSRSSSVSASGNLPPRLLTLPEHQVDEFVGEGDETRDVDYSPICTRRRRKATVGTEATNGGTISRKTSTTTTAIRKRNDSKGVIGKGTASAPLSSSSGSAVNGGGISLPSAYGSSSSIPRRLDIIQPPPAPVAAAALIQHHHHQQHRIRRPQHHMAYQNYYRVNEQHHLPSTMLVRTYSRG
ncbi:FK506-binding protein 5-like [Anopheles marshallii]|uniref:FK506-binding protein 5-like n=1 Tax=Anopheles marshallii TaxID=1521116 RepID=UPI00237AE6DC|nr:FK506-binding protein 5-like [Anopheles marshallii]